MKLLSLRANKSTFRTIVFRETGISIVLAKKHEFSGNKNTKKTYNSVGKSLIIVLIHFCLGSNKDDELKNKLSDWEFFLDFKINDENFTVSRKCNRQSKVTLNNKEMTLNQFREILENKLFTIKKERNYLTFRTLIKRFIRPIKTGYLEFNQYDKEEQKYSVLLNQCFLLGLDLDLVEKKIELWDSYKNYEGAKDNFGKDSLLNNFFQAPSSSEIVDLDEQVREIESKIQNFDIAYDYYETKQELELIKFEKMKFENEATSIKRSIINIRETLKKEYDINTKDLFELFKEIQFNLPDKVIKTFEEVEQFNQKIILDRQRRLEKEVKALETRLKEIENEIVIFSNSYNEKLKYIDSHGALDELTALNLKFNDLNYRLKKMKDAKKILTSYDDKMAETKKDLQGENIKTNQYLNDSEQLIQSSIKCFKDLVSNFYEDKKAGIEITNNQNDNTLRFNINAHIQSDSGGGVNSVKIFCFDMMLLLQKFNHKMNLLVHDSKIFAEMDERQRYDLIKLVNKLSQEHGFQYFCTMNEDQYDSIRSYINDTDKEDLLTESIILELTDRSVEDKLLGIDIDLNYKDFDISEQKVQDSKEQA